MAEKLNVRWAPMLLIGLMALGGCDKWLGGNEDPPLPGTRISILAHERALSPDPQAANSEILLPRPTVNANWPAAGGYPNHAMHHIAVEADLRRAWSVNIGAKASKSAYIIAPPIVADGRVFAMDAESKVSAYDAQTGKNLWRLKLTPKGEDVDLIGGGIAFDEGRIYVTTGFAQVLALDAATGQFLWRREFDAPFHAPPTARGGRLFVLSVDNKLYALAQADGEQLWSHAGITESASILGTASPAVDNGIVVTPYSSGELVALRVGNGQVLWSESLTSVRRTDNVSTLSDIRGRPVIDRGRVFAMSHADVMTSIDLRTGQRIWEKKIGGLENLWIAGNYVFGLTNDQELIALSRDNGRIHWVTALPRWEDPVDKTDPIIWTGPLLVSDRLLVAGSTGDVYAVSPYTGNILGKISLSDGVSVAPIVANGSIFFLSSDADLIAYR